MQTLLGKPRARHAEIAVTDALADTRIVLVNGARQSGKSTLVRLVAKGRDAEWRDLDAALIRQAALGDPDGFVDFPALMVIDEVQRAPELLLSIKAQVDADPRPRRYLLTGSARVLGLRALPDTLVGRMETVELWPFAQGRSFGADVDHCHTEQRTRIEREHRESICRVVGRGLPHQANTRLVAQHQHPVHGHTKSGIRRFRHGGQRDRR